ncbi:class I SAM-dependent methyltransferase [Mesobacillus selenatarsenatis]|uniref:site-specific DNA-methyltransferase (adenine-specific) n=1 Tax=Mesobacillus selenatarsenatis TaxID=388741 RepID=A0A846T6X0_9BACI|nr:class I SAM-dependent methyltransferase [Mesobacillus selenatarsenatis]NKE04658.1 class I SAM-dependent methyltransferase [Mesobacillus selenatarsenatis]
MKLLSDITSQKLRGGYYTPKELCDFIIEWAFFDGPKANVLEPSTGDGGFLDRLNKSRFNDHFESCVAIELIEEEAEKARKKVINNPKFQVINSDFFHEFQWGLRNQKYDLIIGNPPYIRYQYLTEDQRQTQSDILVSNGMKSNKLINAWVSFVVASVQMLSDNGKIGLVIPAELLQVAYAADLRMFLEKSLSKITVITFRELIFPDVQQEIVLLLGEKSTDGLENKISVLELENLDSIKATLHEGLDKLPVEYKDVDHSKDKWTKFFLNNEEIALINEIGENSSFLNFSDIADIDIGITTGKNKYFSVDKNTVEKYELENVTLPLIGRSAHAHGIYFNQADWESNIEEDLLAQLVYFPNEPRDNFPNPHKEYIKWGEESGLSKGFKLGKRAYWYHIPSVWVPDAFFLRRNDKFPKFVLNQINAVSTDTMHRIRFNEGLNHRKILLSYYNSISFAFTEIEGRSYGGGVLEVLPGEAEKILLPNLQDFDDQSTEELLELIDATIRNKTDIEPILDMVDKAVLVDFLNIDPNKVKQFRGIWKKLLNRRRLRKAKNGEQTDKA